MTKLNFKKSMLILIAAMLIQAGLKAQCSGTITLTTQTAVDEFNCTSFSGWLTISGTDITNLDGLSSLESVAGTLMIQNTLVTNVNGLSGLNSVVHLNIVQNTLLEDIDGLSNLSAVVSTLTIEQNTVLTNLNGFSGLNSGVFILTIRSNPALLDIEGLASLSYVEDRVTIASNPVLTDLNGLSGLASLGGLYISDNAALTNLNGLPTLDIIPTFLSISGNTLLTNLDALSGITSIRDLRLYSNPALTNLDGLSSVTSMGNHAYIAGCASLENIDGLASLVSVGGYLTISGCPSLTSVDSLASLNSVGGYLEVKNNTSLSKFCGLYPLLVGDGLSGNYTVSGNTQNPTAQEIIDRGPCIAGCNNFSVELKDSNGDLLAGGSLEYRQGGGRSWYAATEISDGAFCIYTEREKVGLRMTYGPQIQKVGAVPTNEAYAFQTVNVTVELKDNGNPLDDGVVDYTSGGWHSFGTTGDDGAGSGSASLQMLPLQYTFKMTYNGDKENKTELISSGNNLISFELGDLKSGIADANEDFQMVAYPNPFSGNTTIAFSLEKAEEVTVSVFDINGKLVEILQEGMMDEGNHKLSWNAAEVHKGIYLVRFSSNGNVVHKNVVKM